MGVYDAATIMNIKEIEQLKFVRSLGKGGCGITDLYHVKNSYYAVKKLSKKKEGVAKMVDREKAAGYRLKHKNIADFHTHFEDKNYHYLVFEYIEGKYHFAFPRLMMFRNYFIGLCKTTNCFGN
jgi:serine/threonine protein kinase